MTDRLERSPEARRGQSITVAIPCRADEPGLAQVLDEVLVGQGDALEQAASVRLLVCINGLRDPERSAPLRALRDRCARHGIPLGESWVDDESVDSKQASTDAPICAQALLTVREGKARAWNILRAVMGDGAVLFCDADVTFEPGTFRRLCAGLAASPSLTLYSPKTDCRHGRSLLERILAVPYRFDFPNLSGQLYAMRAAGAPERMPDDLIEPERWLELEVGRQRFGRDREARVYVRLTSTLADFFRQRVRIEMGKIQIKDRYATLLSRSGVQPGARTVLGRSAREQAALLAYLALRSAAHACAWLRYRTGLTDGVWRQPVTTKPQPGAVQPNSERML